MSKADFSTMKKEVIERLSYLNSVYLNSVQEPVFGGGNDDMNILDLDGTSVNAQFNFVNIADAKISIFSNDLYTDTSIININSYKQLNMSEINCLPLLDYTNLNNTNTVNFICGLYTLYGILNANYYDKFVSNTKENIPNLPLNIPVYDKITKKVKFQDVSNNIVNNLNYISSTLISNIVNTENFNAFIARRIVYLWILMYHFSISYNFYKQNTTNANATALALACVKLLVTNNSQFEYQPAMTNAVQSSRTAQASQLFYQMWCIVVQTLIPSYLGTFDIKTGKITMKNKNDKCSHIDPSIPISNLQANFDSLVEGYENIESSISSEFINRVKYTLDGITNNKPCVNSLSQDPDSARKIAIQNIESIGVILDTQYKTRNNARNTASDLLTIANREKSNYESKGAALQTAKNNIQNTQSSSNVNTQTLVIAQNNFNAATTAYRTAYTNYTDANDALKTANANLNTTEQLYKNAEQIFKNIATIPQKSINISDLQYYTTLFLDYTSKYKTQSTITGADIESSELYDIKQSISKNITKYRNNQSEINSLAPVFNKNKKDLRSTQLQLTSRKEQAYKLKIYEYVALTILLLITIFAFVIIIMPFEKSMKLLLTTLLTVIVIVNTYILQLVFNRPGIHEKFAGSLQQGNDDISVANISFMDAASSYLLQTETLNIMLQSNNVYNNTNESLSKELSYFNDASEQLANGNEKVKSVYKSSYITQIEYSSAIQLFKTLSIIVAGFTIAYVTLDYLDITGSAYIWVSCITGFLMVIALIIYMLEVSVRVRTDPKQMYWGLPESKPA